MEKKRKARGIYTEMQLMWRSADKEKTHGTGS